MPLIKKILLIPIYILSFFIFLFLKISKPFLQIRFGQISSSRIGHFLINTELYLMGLKEKKEKNFFFDIIYTEENISNLYVHKVFKSKVRFYPRIIFSKIHNINRFIFKDPDFEIQEFGPGGDRDKKNLLSKFNYDFEFNSDEINLGEETLKKLGIPNNSKIVTYCIRDSKYLTKKYPNKNFEYHNYRDWDSQLFINSANSLANKGYYILRMGSIVGNKFETNNVKVIDYANSNFRSDFMDFYLGYKSSFCVTTATGMDSFSFFFRKKLAQIHIPLFSAWTNNGNLLSSCHIYSNTEKKILNLSETFYYFNKINFQVNTNSLQKLGLKIIYHSPEHIVDFCLEAERIYNKNISYSEEDRNLQIKFWDIFKYNIKKYNLLHLHGDMKASFDINFLRKNLDWLK